MPAPKDTALASGQGVGSLSVTLPATVAAGDLILVRFATNANTTVSTPAGYGIVLDASSAGSTSSVIFSKIAVAGDAGATVSTTFGGSSRVTAVVLIYASGTFDPTTPINIVGHTNVTVATTNYTSPAVTTSVAGCTILAWDVEQAPGGTTNTWTPPAGMTLITSVQSAASGGKNNCQACGYLDAGTAGSYGPYTATFVASEVGGASTIAIAPAPAAGGTDASVSAVAATGSAAALAPTLSAGATVQAAVGTVTASVQAPSVSAGTTVSAVVMTATVAMPAPGVTAGGASDVAAVAMTATASLVAPSVQADALVTVPALTASAAALPPTVDGGSSVVNATVSAVPMTVDVTALVPTVTAIQIVTRYVFHTPSHAIHYGDVRRQPLGARIAYPTGMTVLKKDGFYQQVSLPEDEQIASADIAYLGGRDYTITQGEYDDLVAAGYGSYLSVVQSA